MNDRAGMNPSTQRTDLPTDPLEGIEQLDQVLDHVEEIVWITPPDKSEMTFVNEAYEEIWGRPRVELYDDPMSFLSAIHPEDRDRIASSLPRQASGTYDEEYRVVRPDGSQRWVRDRAFPVEDEDGDVQRIVGITQDITARKAMETELREERDLVEEILDTSPVGIVVIDADEHVYFANERASQIFGRSTAEIGQYLTSDNGIVREDGTPLEADALPHHQVFAEDGPVRDQVLGIRQPGENRLWLSVNAAPRSCETGKIQQVILVAEDITEQRELQTELDEILGRVSDAFYALDDRWRFTHVNDQARELLDMEEADLEGEYIWEAFTWAGESRIRRQYEEAMRTQESTAFEVYYPNPLDTWFEVNAYPSDTGLSVYFRDISDRKEREHELFLFRSLIDHSNDDVLVIDPETGQYLDVNRTVCERRGYSREEFLELTVPDLEVAVPDHAAWEAFVERLREAGQLTIEDKHIRKDGCTYPIELSASYVELEQDYVLVIGRDISDRKRKQRQLEASNARLEQFAYAASHDLQEPLRMVSSYLKLIDQRYEGMLDEDGREFLNFAIDGADRMRGMIDGLLEYSRVETHGDEFGAVDLESVIDDVLVDLQLAIEESNAEIDVQSLPEVEGDAGQLRQVFQNLIENALTYAGDSQPQVSICATRNADRVTVQVEDNGIGIPEREQDRIFDVFQRLDPHGSPPGTGIGLALCQRIVERHGGTIGVTSRPNAGSTFNVTLSAAGDEHA